MSDTLELIKTEVDAAIASMTELLKKQSEEIATHGKSSSTTSKAIEAVEVTLKTLGDGFEEEKTKNAKLRADIDEVAKKLGRPGFPNGDDVKSFGKRLVESTELEAFKAGGYVGRSKPLDVKSFFPREKKALTGTAAVRDVLATQRLLEIFNQPLRMARVRDLLPIIPTTQGAIEYVHETGFTNNAQAQAEGSPKIESAIAFEMKTTAIKTIAHWVPIARQLMEDIPALEAYIDTRLIEGLKFVEDEQLLFGDGLSGAILGIMNDPGIQAYNSNQGPATDTKMDAIRRAMTKVRIAEYAATGIVVHPSDWEDIELAKDSQERYLLFAFPGPGGEQRLWRLPVIDTTAMTEGKFLVGAFDMGAAIWDREQAVVRIADQHADFFIKNMLVLLAEERLGLTMYRPEAFVDGTFDPSTS